MRNFLPLLVAAMAVLLVVVIPADAAPNQEQIVTKVMNGLAQEPDINTATLTVGTTEIEAVTLDVANNPALRNRGTLYIQEFRVENLGSSEDLCAGFVDWSGATDCNTLCDAAGATCRTTPATDFPIYIKPGTARSFRVETSKCVCLVADTASTPFHAERVLR